MQLEGKEKFTPNDLTQTLTLIFKTVSNCSLKLSVHDMEGKRKEDEIQKYKLYQENVKKIYY